MMPLIFISQIKIIFLLNTGDFMKHVFMLLLFLPTLGSCTMENDYYRDYPEPSARVRVDSPYYPVRRYYREAPAPAPAPHQHRHNEERREVVRPVAPARHGHGSTIPTRRGYNNRSNVHTHEQAEQSDNRTHGHD